MAKLRKMLGHWQQEDIQKDGRMSAQKMTRREFLKKTGSGSGMIFGNSGGVMEASLGNSQNFCRRFDRAS